MKITRMLVVVTALFFMSSCSDSVLEDFDQIEEENVIAPDGDDDDDDPIIRDPTSGG